MCPAAFQNPTTGSLGEPGDDGNAADSPAELSLYMNTISRDIDHELYHVAYPKSTAKFALTYGLSEGSKSLQVMDVSDVEENQPRIPPSLIEVLFGESQRGA